MADIVDRPTRSRMMSGIRGKNTRPELLVRHFLHKLGYRYRLHVPTLPGQPDLVLPKHRTVIFVHGCFWHRHTGCKFAYTPKSNVRFWRAKLGENRDRDRRNQRKLRACGWRVVIVWECEISPRRMRRLAHEI